MRVWLFAMALSIVSQAVFSQPADDAIWHQNSAESAVRSWIVSETMSPLDYSPTITATTSSQPVAKDAPAILIIRCRGQRTDLLVRTEGSWRASRANDLQVDLRVNDQPAISMQWIASSDGRTAIFKNDAVRFLRSLPDGGRIMFSVPNRQGVAHEALFQLTGLEAIRQKIAAACKWTPADRMAPAER
jgi:type VI secretion system (T6SS) VasI/EvfG family protein